MSRFLAPIHFLVFDKIKRFEELEKDLIITYREKYGEKVNFIVKMAQEKYGTPTENSPLDELIDTDNIHGWLQRTIDTVETRQSAILSEIFKIYGEEAISIAMNAYSSQGAECGNDASTNYETLNAPEIYKALNAYILDGMPCDMVNTITVNTNDKVEWQNTRCLHRGYWESINADIDTFYTLRFIWIRSFVHEANKDFDYNVNKTEVDGVHGFIHEIIRK